MREGEVQQVGTPAEIYNNPFNLFVADFMGSPAMNLIPATIRAEGNALNVVLEREARAPILLPLTKAPAGLAVFQGKKIIFGVRPEALTDPDGAERNASTIATADCHIEVVEPAGSDTFAITNLGGKGVVARLRADANIQSGTDALLAFNLSKAVFFDPATERRIV
jgi:multiple sugar transport system ATP-binding protein